MFNLPAEKDCLLGCLRTQRFACLLSFTIIEELAFPLEISSGQKSKHETFLQDLRQLFDTVCRLVTQWRLMYP